MTPEQMVGKRVAFKDDEEHHDCWHFQAGLKSAGHSTHRPGCSGEWQPGTDGRDPEVWP